METVISTTLRQQIKMEISSIMVAINLGKV